MQNQDYTTTVLVNKAPLDFRTSKQTRRERIRKVILVGSLLTILIPLRNYAQTASDSLTIKSKSLNKNNTAIMTAKDFTTTILVEQSPKEVFNSISNPRGWWQGEINGSTDKLNDEFTYRMEDIHFSKQKLVEVIPNKKIVWLVTDSKLNFIKEKSEWTDTKIVFEISEVNNKTQLRFTHLGLAPEIECFDTCSNAWSQLIQQSLFSFITTGEGKKVF